jgi:hypothetical protein
MRLKSKYRQAFRDGGRVDLSDAPVDPPIEQPAETVSVPPEAPSPAVDNPPPPEQLEPPQNDATAALRAQIENLKRSEQIQHQQHEASVIAAQAAQRRQTWLAQNPKAQHHIPELGEFHNAAMAAGLPDAGDQYFKFMQEQLDAIPDTPMQPTPEFFKPPPPPSARAPAVSAPVSRSIPNGSGRRHLSGKVTLSPGEVEAARLSGISLEEYAKQKVLYENMRADGSYRDSREQR